MMRHRPLAASCGRTAPTGEPTTVLTAGANTTTYTGECVGNTRKVAFRHACACKAQTYRMVPSDWNLLPSRPFHATRHHGKSTAFVRAADVLPWQTASSLPHVLEHLQLFCYPDNTRTTTNWKIRLCSCPCATSHSMRTWEVDLVREDSGNIL